MATRTYEVLPEVAADAATLGVGSDRYPATVISEKNGIVTVQYDDYRVVGGSMMDGSAKYEYIRNENGMIRYFKRNRKGRFVEVVENAATGRFVQTGYTGGLYIGARRRYYDPHF